MAGPPRAKALDELLVDRGTDPETADMFQQLWMQALLVDLIKRLGGSVVYPDGIPIENIFDNQERVELRRGDDGSEELTVGETPPEDRYPDWHRDLGREARAMRKAGRNEPCPCGSGKKFKRCCGA